MAVRIARVSRVSALVGEKARGQIIVMQIIISYEEGSEKLQEASGGNRRKGKESSGELTGSTGMLHGPSPRYHGGEQCQALC
jgi:hypothetical protein